MDSVKLDKIDALAGAAHSDIPPHWYSEAFFFAFTDEDDGDVFTPEDAAYLAACDPATIRDLVAAARERDELRAALTTIGDLCALSVEDMAVQHGSVQRVLMAVIPSIVDAALHHKDGAS